MPTPRVTTARGGRQKKAWELGRIKPIVSLPPLGGLCFLVESVPCSAEQGVECGSLLLLKWLMCLPHQWFLLGKTLF